MSYNEHIKHQAKKSTQAGVVARAFNPRTGRQRQGDLDEFEASLIYSEFQDSQSHIKAAVLTKGLGGIKKKRTYDHSTEQTFVSLQTPLRLEKKTETSLGWASKMAQ